MQVPVPQRPKTQFVAWVDSPYKKAKPTACIPENVNFHAEVADSFNKVGNSFNKVANFHAEVANFHAEVADFINKVGESINKVGNFVNEITRLKDFLAGRVHCSGCGIVYPNILLEKAQGGAANAAALRHTSHFSAVCLAE